MCLEEVKTVAPSCWGGKLCWIQVVDLGKTVRRPNGLHCLLVLASELVGL